MVSNGRTCCCEFLNKGLAEGKAVVFELPVHMESCLFEGEDLFDGGIAQAQDDGKFMQAALNETGTNFFSFFLLEDKTP